MAIYQWDEGPLTGDKTRTPMDPSVIPTFDLTPQMGGSATPTPTNFAQASSETPRYMETDNPSAPAPSYLNSRESISDAYRQLLGRGIGENEYGYWVNRPDYWAGIANSDEGKAFSQRPVTNPTPPTGGSNTGPSSAWNTYGTSVNLADDYLRSQIAAAFARAGRQPSEQDYTYWMGKARTPDVYSDGRTRIGWNPYWAERIATGSDSANPALAGMEGVIGNPAQYGLSFGSPSQAQTYGQPSQAASPSVRGSAFDDPATAQWEQLIRSLVERLNQPVPARTQELQQTQALDPLERQRQQQKDAAALRLSSRGITQGSGVFEEALQGIDRQFNELRTRTQAGLATQDAQNEERRMADAVNLFQRIPNYQDTRLQLAQQALIPANPYQLLGVQQNYQQMAQQNQMYQNSQNQQFGLALVQAALGALGL
jgi:hypothetical protein